MCGKNGEYKDACLLACLDSEARVEYPAELIVGWSLTTKGKAYNTISKWLANRYAK